MRLLATLMQRSANGTERAAPEEQTPSHTATRTKRHIVTGMTTVQPRPWQLAPWRTA